MDISRVRGESIGITMPQHARNKKTKGHGWGGENDTRVMHGDANWDGNGCGYHPPPSPFVEPKSSPTKEYPRVPTSPSFRFDILVP